MTCSTCSSRGKSLISFAMVLISWIKPEMAVPARAVKTEFSSKVSADCHRELLVLRACSRIMLTVLSPIPRVGWLITRSNEGSSCRFEHRRR